MLQPWTPRRRPSCVVVTGLRFEVACMYIADIYEYRLIAARLQVALSMGYWHVTMPFPSLRQRLGALCPTLRVTPMSLLRPISRHVT